MKNSVLVIFFIFVCVCPGIGVCEEKEEVLILKFYTDPVCIYDSAESFTKVPRNSLPDPGKVNLAIENYDRRGMVMFFHDGQEMWVNQAAVKLNKRRFASIICTDPGVLRERGETELSSKEGRVYTQLGLGEGCK